VDGLKPDDVLPLLARLVAASLVAVDPESGGQVRYRLLEPLRQYGLERLEARGARAIQHRHAEFFLALALEVEPASIGVRPMGRRRRGPQRRGRASATICARR
jgi:predicted ATPase